MPDESVTIETLWDKLDRVEQRIGERIDSSEQRLAVKIDGNVVSVVRVEGRVDAHEQRLGAFDDTVKNLKTWDKVVGAVGAVVGPAVAAALTMFRRD